MSAASKVIYNIGDALENVASLSEDQREDFFEKMAAVGTPIGADEPITMYTGRDIFQKLLYAFSEFSFYSSTLLYTSPTWALAGLWEAWMDWTGSNWANAYSVLYHKEYDPIHNYDGTESETITITHSGTDTDERTPDLTMEESPDTVDESGIYGVNSSTPVNRERNTKTGSTTTTTTGSETTEHTYDSEESTTRSLTKGGNLGVTTTQQMIQQEIELRKHNLLNEIIKSFIDQNCFLFI